VSRKPSDVEKTKIDGRMSKIIVLPRSIVFGTVGRVDLTEKLFRGITHMCQEHDLVSSNSQLRCADSPRDVDPTGANATQSEYTTDAFLWAWAKAGKTFHRFPLGITLNP